MAFNRTLQHFTSSQELATLWASGQSYILNQIVIVSNSLYLCSIAHTSGASFATDLSAGKWNLLTGTGSNPFYVIPAGGTLSGTYTNDVYCLGNVTLTGNTTIEGNLHLFGNLTGAFNLVVGSVFGKTVASGSILSISCATLSCLGDVINIASITATSTITFGGNIATGYIQAGSSITCYGNIYINKDLCPSLLTFGIVASGLYVYGDLKIVDDIEDGNYVLQLSSSSSSTAGVAPTFAGSLYVRGNLHVQSRIDINCVGGSYTGGGSFTISGGAGGTIYVRGSCYLSDSVVVYLNGGSTNALLTSNGGVSGSFFVEGHCVVYGIIQALGGNKTVGTLGTGGASGSVNLAGGGVLQSATLNGGNVPVGATVGRGGTFSLKNVTVLSSLNLSDGTGGTATTVASVNHFYGTCNINSLTATNRVGVTYTGNAGAMLKINSITGKTTLRNSASDTGAVDVTAIYSYDTNLWRKHASTPA